MESQQAYNPAFMPPPMTQQFPNRDNRQVPLQQQQQQPYPVPSNPAVPIPNSAPNSTPVGPSLAPVANSMFPGTGSVPTPSQNIYPSVRPYTAQSQAARFQRPQYSPAPNQVQNVRHPNTISNDYGQQPQQQPVSSGPAGSHPQFQTGPQTYPSNNYGQSHNQVQHQQPQQHYPHQQMYPQPQQIRPADASHGYNGYGQQGDHHGVNNLANQLGGLSVTHQGFNKLWGTDSVNLLEQRTLIPTHGIKPPDIRFQHEYMNSINCSPDIFRCTLTKIPETKALLQKSRLPLGILIHPFKDLTQLPVIQCSTIVRCRSCRTYINPYVYFVDTKRWKCNLCSRVNDLPEEFQYDPVTKTYGDPSRRPEVKSATIEFLAPADYMVRPPQAAVYLYLLDISSGAVDTGYLKQICDTLLEQMDQIPGDARAQIGFIAYDSFVHFFNLAENLNQPHELVVCDIDDIFIPCPDNLLVSLSENRSIVRHLLTQLPTKYLESSDSQSALGAALVAAQKLLAPIGGRITVFQHTLPTLGPGSLVNREAHVKNANKDLKSALNPATDFYKKLALDCSTQYIAVDLFFINSQYVDIASISCAAKFSGGCVYHFPNYHYTENPTQSTLFEQAFQRYVTRKIGFEAVMRVRCSRGLSIHTFHGNFFVRSTDLLSLPNCNPDSGFGMQVSIDENLTDFQHVCFQAALLYTSSKGERRIRVHTLCLPVVGNLNDVLSGADQQCVMGLVAKMAVDKSIDSGLMDAREAFMNVVVDVLSAYMTTQNSLPSLQLVASHMLKMLPLYTHAILRSSGFRSDLQVRLDERVHFMNQMKTLPLLSLIQTIYPDLYPIHNVSDTPLALDCDEEVPDFPLIHLCSSRIEAHGVYVMDKPDLIIMYVCRSVSREFCQQILGVDDYASIKEMGELPELDNPLSSRVRNFISNLQLMKPHFVPLRIFREESRERMLFVRNLIEDRGDSSSSYYEFLQQLKTMIR